MLVQTYTSTEAPTCRRLQPSLVYQPLLEGSYYPLLSFTSYHWKGATTPFLKASTLSTTADHVSSTFICDIPCRSPDLFIFYILTPVPHDLVRHSHQRFIIIFMGASQFQIYQLRIELVHTDIPFRNFIHHPYNAHIVLYFSSPYIVFPLLKP